MVVTIGVSIELTIASIPTFGLFTILKASPSWDTGLASFSFAQTRRFGTASITPGQIERDPLGSVAGSRVPVGRWRKITMLTTNTHVGKPRPSGSRTSGKTNIATAIT